MQEYHHNNIHLYRRDCMEALAEMPDNALDLAIVDPEYGIGMDGGQMGKNFFKKKEWDQQPPPPEYFQQLTRVSKNQIIWGGNYFADLLPTSSGWILWDKGQDGTNWSHGELAWTSYAKPLQVFRYKNQGNFVGFPGKITTKTKKQEDKKIHPTQKPIALYEWLLENYTKSGQTILDTHLGSGSIAIACEKMGYSLTGFEIDQEYFDGAVDRFKKHLKQPRLDFSTPTPLPEQLTIPDE